MIDTSQLRAIIITDITLNSLHPWQQR